MLADHLLKIKKEFKKILKPEIQNIFPEMNQVDFVFSMLLLMEILKNLARKTASDKVLRNKAINIAKNAKYDRYQRGLTSMVYHFF